MQVEPLTLTFDLDELQAIFSPNELCALLARARDTLAEDRVLAQSSDSREAAHALHRIKGTAQYLGVHDMAHFLLQVEQALIAQDEVLVAQLNLRCSAYLAALDTLLAQTLRTLES